VILLLDEEAVSGEGENPPAHELALGMSI
jgi:hypothetical protein